MLLVNNLEPNNATLMALLEILDINEVLEFTSKNQTTLNRMKRGLFNLGREFGDLDKQFLEANGFTICQCCGNALVPKKPVRYQLLTTLCEACWTGDLADVEEYHLGVDYGEADNDIT